MRPDAEWPSWKICLRVCVCVLGVFLCIRYWSALEGLVGLVVGGLASVFIGVAIAYIVNIPMSFYERHLPERLGPGGAGTRRRTVALLLAVLSAVAVVAAVVGLVVPQFLSAVVTLAQRAPSAVGSILSNEVVAALVPADIAVTLQALDWQTMLSDIVGWLQTGVTSSLPQIVSVVSSVASGFMGLIFSIWFLAGKERLSATGYRLLRVYLGPAAEDGVRRALALVDDSFHRYMVGQSLEACILGGLITVVMLILRLPYATMIGALITVLALIPMVGGFIGAVVGAFMILSVSWQQAVVFVIAFIVVQQFEGNVIYVRVVGRMVGISSLLTLLGVTLGGAFLGIVGAFVGVPITATVYRALQRDLERREQDPGKTGPFGKISRALGE